MSSTIKIRITDFAKQQGLSVRKFEEICQLGRGNISNMKDDGAIGSDKLSKIIDKFPTISLEWLLTGKGEVLKKSEKKSENFSDKNVPPLELQKMSPHCGKMSPHFVPPIDYNPHDGRTHDFSAEPYSDQQQIDTLNKFIAELQRALEQKNELLAAKDELLKSKDQIITTQNEALKLLEGQINATTALIEQLTLSIGNDTKKRTERADARDASDVGVR